MVFGWFRRLFKKKPSDATAMQSDVTSTYSELTRESPLFPSELSSYSAATSISEDEKIKLEKESLQLGLAAGYTGRALHDILSSLNRIETLMITKDWLIANDKSPQLYELLNAIRSILETHDKQTMESFLSIKNSLDKLSLLAGKIPEPIKSELTHEIEQMESRLLSPVMEKLLTIVKETGEISYKDITSKLGYKNVSSLRSLLSRMLERTDKIEKFNRNGEKWLRVTAR